ncbi:hypothetical protein C8R43DRAFT_1131685 [Mycena crocata]|nr:hypothetical protein C8R43DRAFT_1131685 [Mycena crocata]
MSHISEISLFLLTSALPPSTSFRIMTAVLFLTLTATGIYYASPARLTHVLVVTMQDARTTYFSALEAGIISSSNFVDMSQQFSALQTKVSIIRSATLRNSLSLGVTLREFLKGYALTVQECIHEVQEFQTRIEILKEERLHDPSPIMAVQATSLRRRNA